MVRRVVIVAGLAVALHPFAARAQSQEALATTEAEARARFDSGLEALRTGRYEAARTDFEQSLRLLPRPSTKYDLALTLFRLGKVVESRAMLRELAGDETPLPEDLAAPVKTLLPLAEALVADLHVELHPGNATLWVDGRLLDHTPSAADASLSPGFHHLRASAAGYGDTEVDVSLAPGERRVVMVRLAALPRLAAPSSPAPSRDAPRTGPWWTLGAAGALLAGGIVTGIVAKNADAEVKRGCPSLRDCDPHLQASGDRAAAFGRASDVLLVSSGVLAGIGVAWAVWPVSSDAGQTRAELRITGRF